MNTKIIGKSINRVGGQDRVTGTQRYVADVKLPNMLHAKLVHLDCAHARILSIDTTEALKVTGVHAILTGEDIPKPIPRFGPVYRDRPLLAVGTTQFHGEPVAIVAAETEHSAAVAESLVKVEYEELPAIFSVGQALDPSAELIQDPSIRVDGPFKNTNILDEWHFGWGDVENCRADEVIENNYVFPIVTQFAIEPFAFLAEPTMDGITVYSAIQNPYLLQRIIAAVLDMPLARVRIIAPDPGGGFGGKQHAKFEPLLAYFSLRLGRPLRLELNLEESSQAVRRAAAEVRV
ncbi:MAG: molybdopterin cofactor-binding domain-containing protein, partial [Candidatus Neomarinimicrobiota bacterium]